MYSDRRVSINGFNFWLKAKLKSLPVYTACTHLIKAKGFM
jgi:hypothetical protein